MENISKFILLIQPVLAIFYLVWLCATKNFGPAIMGIFMSLFFGAIGLFLFSQLMPKSSMMGGPVIILYSILAAGSGMLIGGSLIGIFKKDKIACFASLFGLLFPVIIFFIWR